MPATAVAPSTQADQYAGESTARAELLSKLNQLGFTLENYAVNDKLVSSTSPGTAGKRTVAATIGFGSENRPEVYSQLKEIFEDHGYDLKTVKLSIQATKQVTDPNQIRMFEGDADPDAEE